MKHSFKTKKVQLKNIFAEKLEINTISIENKSDVSNSINLLLNFIELENVLIPKNCSYNFIKKEVSFQLELNKNKQDFFNGIKKFTDYIN